MFSTALVDIGVIFVAAVVVGPFVCWSRFPLAVIYDSGRYYEVIFATRPFHVAKDP